jgi:hypothetical protein
LGHAVVVVVAAVGWLEREGGGRKSIKPVSISAQPPRTTRTTMSQGRCEQRWQRRCWIHTSFAHGEGWMIEGCREKRGRSEGGDEFQGGRRGLGAGANGCMPRHHPKIRHFRGAYFADVIHIRNVRHPNPNPNPLSLSVHIVFAHLTRRDPPPSFLHTHLSHSVFTRWYYISCAIDSSPGTSVAADSASLHE